jgi:hypothetical protein
VSDEPKYDSVWGEWQVWALILIYCAIAAGLAWAVA